MGDQVALAAVLFVADVSIAAGVAAKHYRNTGYESAEAERQFFRSA
jgi:hypothetical protein